MTSFVYLPVSQRWIRFDNVLEVKWHLSSEVQTLILLTSAPFISDAGADLYEIWVKEPDDLRVLLLALKRQTMDIKPEDYKRMKLPNDE